MNYNEFKFCLSNAVNESFGEDGELTIKITTVPKTNISEDAIQISIADSKYSPLIYLQPLYEDYLRTGSFNSVLTSFRKLLAEALEYIHTQRDLLLVNDLSKAKSAAKEHIIFCLINTEWNKELLTNIPHRNFLNLSIVYRWVHSLDDNGFKNSLITNAVAASLELSESDLYEYAMINTQKLFPVICRDINEVIRGIEQVEAGDLPICPMKVLTNSYKINGASVILYKGLLGHIAQHLKSDLIILPSSLHELIIFPVNALADVSGDAFGGYEELSNLVQAVNASTVDRKEQLSDTAYFYDSDKDSLCFISDIQ